jgi:hypothetical protein
MGWSVEAFLDAAYSTSSKRNGDETQRAGIDRIETEKADPVAVVSSRFEHPDEGNALSSIRTPDRETGPRETRTETRMPSEVAKLQDLRRSQRGRDN